VSHDMSSSCTTAVVSHVHGVMHLHIIQLALQLPRQTYKAQLVWLVQCSIALVGITSTVKLDQVHTSTWSARGAHRCC
jgi:uncharacterized membrane-anchored protein